MLFYFLRLCRLVNFIRFLFIKFGLTITSFRPTAQIFRFSNHLAVSTWFMTSSTCFYLRFLILRAIL